MTWANDYVGLPFRERGRQRDGCDCWGLVRLVLSEVYGVEVPSLHTDYIDPHDRTEIGALIEARRDGAWLPLDPAEAQAGDVVLLRHGRLVCHVGILIAPRMMLHIQEGIGAAVERLDSPLWANKVNSYWRHRDLAGASNAA